MDLSQVRNEDELITINFHFSINLCQRSSRFRDFTVHFPVQDASLTWKKFLIKYAPEKVVEFTTPLSEKAFVVRDKRDGRGKFAWNMNCRVAKLIQSFKHSNKQFFNVVVYYPKAGEEVETPAVHFAPGTIDNSTTATANDNPAPTPEAGAIAKKILCKFTVYVDNSTAHRIRKEVRKVYEVSKLWNHLLKYIPTTAKLLKDVFLHENLMNLHKSSFHTKGDSHETCSLSHTINSQDSCSDLSKSRIQFKKLICEQVMDNMITNLTEDRAQVMKQEISDNSQSGKIMAFVNYMPSTAAALLLMFGNGTLKKISDSQHSEELMEGLQVDKNGELKAEQEKLMEELGQLRQENAQRAKENSQLKTENLQLNEEKMKLIAEMAAKQQNYKLHIKSIQRALNRPKASQATPLVSPEATNPSPSSSSLERHPLQNDNTENRPALKRKMTGSHQQPAHSNSKTQFLQIDDSDEDNETDFSDNDQMT